MSQSNLLPDFKFPGARAWPRDGLPCIVDSPVGAKGKILTAVGLSWPPQSNFC